VKTPVLLMDRTRILQNYQDIEKALPDFKIAYAVKSNNHPEIVNILKRSGSLFEVASLYEIENLLSMGIEPENIIYSNPVKPPDDIKSAAEKKVCVMSFDSVTELEKILPYKDNVKLLFRIEVPNEGSLWPLSGKFGCPSKLWDKIYSYMQKHSIKLSGITYHVGSQCENLPNFKSALLETKKAYQLAKSYGLDPYILNIGGGFPVYLGREIPPIKQIAEIILETIEDLKKDGVVFTEFYAEPGRFISGSAGTLLSKVIGIAERENNKWVFLDTGVFSGMMETVDGITYPLLSTGSGKSENVMLCGPTCDSMDKMFKAMIPNPKVGDNIYFSGAGAYTTVYASDFNGFSRPDITFLDSVDEQLPQEADLENHSEIAS